ncbi:MULTISPECIES: hypothetical protein [unclassified Xanthobacter]|uniref:hypothetical protein n=1 Tax=unclassified Xanthobacter TaxID=2623496 RepID=UPI001F21C8E6|nr:MULTISPECIES: hypothetical protein [unclassified Xanthobacter]
MTPPSLQPAPALPSIGRALSIEAFPDAIARGLSELRRQPVAYDLRLRWIGGALPPWADPEPDTQTPARWSLLVVENGAALRDLPAGALVRADATWRIALLPEDEGDAGTLSPLGAFHLVLRCPGEELSFIAEDLAHFLLRSGVIGSDEHDLTTGCMGMAEGRRVDARARCMPGKGRDAARALRLSLDGDGARGSRVPWMVMGQFIRADVSWSLAEVDDAAHALAEGVDGPHLLKCLPDAPRTELLVITPAR